MDDRGTPLLDADERARTYPESFCSYIASKARGEAATLAANAPDFRTVVLRPPGIWGPGDPFTKALPRLVQSGMFAFIDRGDYPFVTCHIDNVVEAIACALDAHDGGGEAYFVNDPETTTFRAFISGLAAATGVSVDRAPSMPYGLAWTLGGIMEVGAAALGMREDPPMSRAMVRLIGRPFVTADARARERFGYRGAVTRAQGSPPTAPRPDPYPRRAENRRSWRAYRRDEEQER